MTRHFFLTASVIALLSACDESGGSSGDIDVTSGDTGAIGGDDIVPEEVVSFAELQERENQLGLFDGSFFDDLEEDFDVPTTGSATYTGVVSVFSVISVNDESDEQVLTDLNDFDFFEAVGATTLTADFDDQSISGTADNFFQLDNNFFQLDNLEVESTDDLTGERIDGSLEYDLVQDVNGFGGSNFYVGNISGSLSPTNVADIDIDQSINGEFFGEDADRFVASSSPRFSIDPDADSSSDSAAFIDIAAARD